MLKLVKYRDSGMHTYTYFWINDNNSVVSPYFNSQEQALEWEQQRQAWDNWRPNRDIV
jgi:hypothetical protein